MITRMMTQIINKKDNKNKNIFKNYNVTINVPLIWKVREIIFFLAGKTHNGTVQGIFRGGRDLFDP